MAGRAASGGTNCGEKSSLYRRSGTEAFRAREPNNPSVSQRRRRTGI